MLNNDTFFIPTENCSCVGIANQWKDGAECNDYRGYYEHEFMNSKWCYAETTTCRDSTTVEYPKYLTSYVEEGRYGPSQSACTNPGKSNNSTANLITKRI